MLLLFWNNNQTELYGFFQNPTLDVIIPMQTRSSEDSVRVSLSSHNRCFVESAPWNLQIAQQEGSGFLEQSQ